MVYPPHEVNFNMLLSIRMLPPADDYLSVPLTALTLTCLRGGLFGELLISHNPVHSSMLREIQEMLKVELRMKIYYLSISLLFKVQYIYFTSKEWRKMVKLSLCVPTMFHFESRYFSVDILQITLEAT